VAGPLGAVVGAAVGSTIGKRVANKDGALEEADHDVSESSTPSKPSTADFVSDSVRASQQMPDVPVGAVGQTGNVVGYAASEKRLKVARAQLDRTEMVWRKTQEKCAKMESEMQELYAKAEKCLAAGDDQEARTLLHSRAELDMALTEVRQLLEDATALRQQQQKELSLLGGSLQQDASPMSDELELVKQKVQAKRAKQSEAKASQSAPKSPQRDDLTALKQKLEARRATLSADAEKRYAMAEDLLRAGDEQGARKVLAEYQELKHKLENLAISDDPQAI